MLDILLLILLGVGFVGGLVSGAVRQVISLVAFVLGFVVACLYYGELSAALTQYVSVPGLCDVLAFAMLWIAVPVVAGVVASLLTSVLNKLPAIGMLNRLLGGLLGLLKYALVLGALIMLFSQMGLLREETLQASRLARPLGAVPEFIYNTLKNHTRNGCSENQACLVDQLSVPGWEIRRG